MYRFDGGERHPSSSSFSSFLHTLSSSSSAAAEEKQAYIRRVQAPPPLSLSLSPAVGPGPALLSPSSFPVLIRSGCPSSLIQLWSQLPPNRSAISDPIFACFQRPRP